MILGIIAAGSILHYLDITQHEKLNHITKLTRIEAGDYVWLDKFTIRNLELFYSPYEGAHTLIDVLDKTIGPMGGRMLKKWMSLPLKDAVKIKSRLDAVAFLVENSEFRDNLASGDWHNW